MISLATAEIQHEALSELEESEFRRYDAVLKAYPAVRTAWRTFERANPAYRTEARRALIEAERATGDEELTTLRRSFELVRESARVAWETLCDIREAQEEAVVSR